MRLPLASPRVAATLLAGLALFAGHVSADVPPAPVFADLVYVAFGGPGVTACRDASCLDGEYRVLAVVMLVNRTDAPRPGFSTVRIDVLRPDGSVASTSRGTVELVAVPDSVPASDLSFAPGTPFDGTLRPGTTRIRVQTWMTHRPPNGARVRVVLGTPSNAVTTPGTLPPYEWPT